LSSGGTLGYFHFGVARCLLEESLLPKIISGSSAGALVAAFLATRTEDELHEQLTPDLYRYLTACEESWPRLLMRYLSTGCLFDEHNFARKTRKVVFGDLTFQEAFERSGGRVLNITVTSTLKYGAPVLLNHITAPHVVIWSAVCASSAMPGLLNAVQLLQKLPRDQPQQQQQQQQYNLRESSADDIYPTESEIKDVASGTEQVELQALHSPRSESDGSVASDAPTLSVLKPFRDFGMAWSDGVIKNDIPTSLLSQLLNANFFIVSQMNPHVVPFLFESKGSSGNPNLRRRGRGSGLRGGFIQSTIEALLRLEMRKWLMLVQEMDLLPQIYGVDFSSFLLQTFTGTVTISAQSRGLALLSEYARLLSDPSRNQMKEYLEHGARFTWPKICMIRNHYLLERTLDDCEHELRFRLSA